ncbi:hypothetical protein Pony_5 [Bacillus phage Pony]|uniref:Uncharacterized protein n=1 Tax=Bacillus phage Pony TaxID=1406789 RepID=U5PWV3_9CAUD|nr:hypothetical protein Pony_5 [Bacillus phage Pony]AGY48246.1 hypothetical protein Pony_5 [Bacillus phage Pony]
MENELAGLGNQTEAAGGQDSFDQQQGFEGQEQQQGFEQQQQGEAQPQAEPQYFNVKYNKEEMQIPYDQAPDYIQKGLNYDKQVERLNTYQSDLERVARVSGYGSVEEMREALSQHEQELEAEQWREQGIDPDAMNKFLENHPDIQYAREMKAQQAAQQQFDKYVSEFQQAHPDVTPNDVSQEVFNLMDARGLSLTEAYRIHNYDQLAKSAQQKAINSLNQNSSSSPGSLGAAGAEHTQSVSSMSSADFAKMIAQVKAGERTSF